MTVEAPNGYDSISEMLKTLPLPLTTAPIYIEWDLLLNFRMKQAQAGIFVNLNFPYWNG